MRTSNINPFEEAWLWGDVNLEGTIDVTASATLSITKEWTKTVARLPPAHTDRACTTHAMDNVLAYVYVHSAAGQRQHT